MGFVSEFGNEVFTKILLAVASFAAGFAFDRLSPHCRLTGRWEGTLFCNQKHPREVINCSLVLARPERHSNSGYLYYSRELTSSPRYLAVGVDELHRYTIIRRGLTSYSASMQFIRRIHKNFDNTLDLSSEARTDCVCTCDGGIRKHTLRLVTTIRDRSHSDDLTINCSTWSGDLVKR